ncbi:MAG: hypothetical protein ACPLQO_10810 [Desulfotomaculales bacterium]
MKYTDMDMLQDYEKDARMAAVSFILIQTEIIDQTLRRMFARAADEAAVSQQKAMNLILSRGDRA